MGAIWNALKKSLLGLLGSKKAVVAIASILVGLAARYGIELEQQAVLEVVGPLWLYVVAQGIADFGKGKAEAISTGISEGAQELALLSGGKSDAE